MVMIGVKESYGGQASMLWPGGADGVLNSSLEFVLRCSHLILCSATRLPWF